MKICKKWWFWVIVIFILIMIIYFLYSSSNFKGINNTTNQLSDCERDSDCFCSSSCGCVSQDMKDAKCFAVCQCMNGQCAVIQNESDIMRKVTIKTDKNEYKFGIDNLTIILINNFTERACFFCGKYTIQKNDGEKWIFGGKIMLECPPFLEDDCLEPGKELTFIENIEELNGKIWPEKGIYRLESAPQTNCITYGKYNELKCLNQSVIYSEEFTIK